MIYLDKTYNTEPLTKYLCKTPIDPGTGNPSLRLWQYHEPPILDVKCSLCPEGTNWDEECKDCVPICFPDMLAMLQIINANLPAKIIG
jgi:hypothetical protein